ncbi:MAG: molecular chaperone TorD family protein [Actinomycetota bacterium]|nr:molecular chaperone TorD family protein [Actinomycetota bacterium]
MFTYSLQGLALASESTGPVEVEESPTTARSAIYQVLGSFFAADPASGFEKSLDGSWAKELAEAGTLLPFDLVDGEVAGTIEGGPAAYAAEHERFLGGATLLGGARGDRDAELASVHREYEYFGLAADPGATLPPDHLATELDFMQYLCFKEAASPSARLATSFRRAQRDFLANHLLTWVPDLVAGAVQAGAGPSFAWAFGALGSFLTADHAYVADLLGA